MTEPDDTPTLTVDASRPDAETLAALAELGVATVYEASGRRGLIDIPLQPLQPAARVAGPARIAACAQDDNRAVHEAMAAVEPGDVLVLTMPQPRPVALIGELLATQAQTHGAAAILVDAAIRDRDELVELGLPIWTRDVRATGATKDHRGSVDVPVIVGGALVRPGDVVVLDADGAVAVAAEDVATVLDASRARLERETALRARFAAGELSYDIYGMREADRAR
jgi:4-hydroxy-4-methyl-2-oxoglutarate aldolase